MNTLSAKLLNDFQRNFPLHSTPFALIAHRLHTSPQAVLRVLQDLQARGAVSRVGPVFRPNTVGASTLAAIAVAPRDLDAVAAIVNRYPQVNHNYEREHRYNLWFVVTAEHAAALQQTLRHIRQETGYPVLALPLVRDYHIDLGFRMNLNHVADVNPLSDAALPATAARHDALPGDAEDLIELIQDGLPLVERPYLHIASRLGCTEQSVIDRLRDMIDAGIIKRLGVVVRHHELGYRANAMVVWDVPDAGVDRLGHLLGQQDCVTLCYRRPRRRPDWPYNLFCMVHGKDRREVLTCIERMVEELELEGIARTVLFSGRRFKQRGARYRGCH